MKSLSVLIKPTSSLCNLRCKYCFYANVSDLRKVKSYGMMQEDTMKKLIDNTFAVLDHGDQITFAFQGGEPTMVGIEYYKSFARYVESKKQKVIVRYSIQTNGTFIDDEWCKFLSENNFLVGLSIDGIEELHDKNRIDINGQGTYKNVIKTKRLLEKYKIEFNILCVLTNQIAYRAEDIFTFIKEERIKYIQFIPCLDELNSILKSDYALTPKSFAHFYKELFLLWKNEFNSGNYISVNLFDNIITLLAKGIPITCGIIGKCQPQFIIESDGSVYPCDFYVLDKYNLGSIKEKNLLDLLRTSTMQNFIHEPKEEKEICLKCKFYKMCNGGCKRMKNAMYIENKGKYCGYQDFLNTTIEDLKKIAMTIRY